MHRGAVDHPAEAALMLNQNPYRWRCYNYETQEERSGVCRSLNLAKEAAESGKLALGFKKTSAQVWGPRGSHYIYQHNSRRSGMHWGAVVES